MTKNLKKVLLTILLLVTCVFSVSIVSNASKISEKELILEKGETKKLKINGTSSKVKWSSSKKSVAKVSSSGKVTGLKLGKTTIKGKVKNKTYKCNVIVVKKIDPTPSVPMRITVGESYESQLMYFIPDKWKSKAIWMSDNPKVLSVNKKTGMMTAKKAGAAVISALCGTTLYYREIQVELNHTLKDDEWEFGPMHWSTAVLERYKGNKTKVTLPKEIDNFPVSGLFGPLFKGNTKIKEVIIPEGITNEIPAECFNGCVNLTKVVIPEGVTVIGYDAFKGCKKLKSITIPNSLQKLEITPGTSRTSPFDYSGVTTFNLPKNFKGTEDRFDHGWIYFTLENINVEKGNPWIYSVDGVVYDKKTNKMICYPDCKNLKSFKVPNRCTEVNDHEFEDGYGLRKHILKKVSIPKNCKISNWYWSFTSDGRWQKNNETSPIQRKYVVRN